MPSFPLLIAAAYAVISALWIILSDRAVEFLVGSEVTVAQTYKGWAFVTVTALLLYGALRTELAKRTAAEEERESGRRLMAAALRHLPVGFFAVEGKTRKVLLHSNMTERLLGHSIFDLTIIGGESRHGGLCADGSPYREEDYPSIRALRTGVTIEQERMRYRRKDGSIAVFMVNAAPVPATDPERTVVVCAFSDVTEQIRLEQELREKEERLQLALAASNAGTFDWNVETGTVRWSAKTFELFGLNPDEEITDDKWRATIHPEDRERVLGYRRDILRAGITEYRIDYRVVHRDGRVRWIAGRGKVEFSAENRPLRLHGLNIDITDQKTVEDDLRRELDQARKALAEREKASASPMS